MVSAVCQVISIGRNCFKIVEVKKSCSKKCDLDNDL
jgi:hypothetical protein